MCEQPAIGGYTHPRCTTRYSIDGLTSFFHYDGPVRKGVKAIKYRLVSDLAEEFVSQIPDMTLNSLAVDQQSVFIPVPLHRTRLRARGFNQVEVIGRPLAVRLRTPVRTDILHRVRETVPQVEMEKREARLKNMRGVFRASCVSGVKNALLFDDVFTTGATMRSAAHVLKRSGVTHVWAVTMAR